MSVSSAVRLAPALTAGRRSKDMSMTDVGEVLITEKQIRARAKELGEQITKDYRGRQLVVVCTLNGGVMWTCDLIKNIDLDVRLDFLSAHSYGSSTVSSGVINVTHDLETNIKGKDVLFVEDIIDSGNTMAHLLKLFRTREPHSLAVCTMLNKEARRTADLKPDYIGFEVDDLFIVGYGLDFDQKYRHLPYVSYLRPEDIDD